VILVTNASARDKRGQAPAQNTGGGEWLVARFDRQSEIRDRRRHGLDKSTLCGCDRPRPRRALKHSKKVLDFSIITCYHARIMTRGADGRDLARLESKENREDRQTQANPTDLTSLFSIVFEDLRQNKPNPPMVHIFNELREFRPSFSKNLVESGFSTRNSGRRVGWRRTLDLRWDSGRTSSCLNTPDFF